MTRWACVARRRADVLRVVPLRTRLAARRLALRELARGALRRRRRRARRPGGARRTRRGAVTGSVETGRASRARTRLARGGHERTRGTLHRRVAPARACGAGRTIQAHSCLVARRRILARVTATNAIVVVKDRQSHVLNTARFALARVTEDHRVLGRRAGACAEVEGQGADTWIFRGGKSRHRRGHDGDIPSGRVAARPRPRRGYSVETSRGGAAAPTWIVHERRGAPRGDATPQAS